MSTGGRYRNGSTVDAMTRRILPLSLLSVAGVAIVLAGCGGGSSSSSTTQAAPASASTSSTPAAAKGEVVNLSADPSGQLRFTQTKLSVAKPGTVTLVMRNPASAGMAHGISIEGNGVDRDGPMVDAGKTSMVTAVLKKGTYTYYCPVPGHRQAGMTGTLTVK
jgi:plastocyanin